VRKHTRAGGFPPSSGLIPRTILNKDTYIFIVKEIDPPIDTSDPSATFLNINFIFFMQFEKEVASSF
jgi:hypothetical protein